MTSNMLIQALRGGTTKTASSVDTGLTDPVYVEKLASAVDFICENLDDDPVPSTDPQKTASAAEPETTPLTAPVDLTARLRERLHAKLQTKQAAAPEDTVIENVLGRLISLRSAPAVKTAAVAVPEDDPPEETESAPADEVPAVKTAQVGETLAEMLDGALHANELEEGVPQDRSKIASVRGNEGPKARKAVVDSLKGKLMAKFGKEA